MASLNFAFITECPAEPSGVFSLKLQDGQNFKVKNKQTNFKVASGIFSLEVEAEFFSDGRVP